MNEFKETSRLYESENLTDSICQWIYNKPKYKKNGTPETHRKKVGFIVATKEPDGMISFGWSKCYSHDAFNLERAKDIAYGRLNTGTEAPFPSVFRKFMPEFILRCKKYFQSDEVQPINFA